MRVIIIGNSATMVGAVESLRQYDQVAEILVFSEEPHGIYSRPLLDHYLAGHIDQARVLYRPNEFYTKHNVKPLLSTQVAAIHPEAHEIVTALGESYAYDKLLIATGGAPIVPPLAGLDAKGVYTFTRLDDSKGILCELKDGHVQDAIVVGGGMIGIKATDALMKRGARVTMVELAPRILSAALDETGAGLLARLLADAGVTVLTENTLTAVHNQDGRIVSVDLKDGRNIPCQLLVFGIGVRPNAGLAKEASIQVNRGIVVDQFMRTTAPDVYAAGDVAEAYDLVVDMNRTVAIWPNAYRQGAIAGAHMAGVERPDRGGVAMNVVEVCGTTGMAVGNANVVGPEYEVLAALDERGRTYKRLVLKEGRLVGAILIGDVSRAGIYTGLIRNKINVASARDRLLSKHFGLVSLPDDYRKHLVTGQGIEV
ncbi:MAG: FAD-dependent oxidoreductase [Chloroflexota bacterium]